MVIESENLKKGKILFDTECNMIAKKVNNFLVK